MTTAQKLGLLPPMSWLAGGGPIAIFIKCFLLTPVMMIVIGIVLESRLIPLTPDKQFLSFIPGDIFLSLFAGSLLVLSSKLPAKKTWYNSLPWQIFALIACLSVAGVVHFVAEAAVYPPAALNSPTKLYHDIVLYGLFSYLIIPTAIANLVMRNLRAWRWLIVLLWLAWLALAISDSIPGTNLTGIDKTKTAHIANWQPIWRNIKNSP